jgi:Cu/Ag efflux pump CusA
MQKNAAGPGLDAKLQFPGLSNTWIMPVENRLDMELTGIKTPLGLKIQGPNLEGIQQPVFFALMKERALRRGTLQPKESHVQG